MHTCIYIYTSVYICTYINAFLHIHMYACMHICICIHTNRLCLFTRSYAHGIICILFFYFFICICIYIYIMGTAALYRVCSTGLRETQGSPELSFIQIDLCVLIYGVMRMESYVYMQHTATHCNTLQHTATHCNTLQQCVLIYGVMRMESYVYIHKSIYTCTHICTYTHLYTYTPIYLYVCTDSDSRQGVWLQSGEDPQDALSGRSFFATGPHGSFVEHGSFVSGIWLFCGIWPVKMTHPMVLHHPVLRQISFGDEYVIFDESIRIY